MRCPGVIEIISIDKYSERKVFRSPRMVPVNSNGCWNILEVSEEIWKTLKMSRRVYGLPHSGDSRMGQEAR